MSCVCPLGGGGGGRSEHGGRIFVALGVHASECVLHIACNTTHLSSYSGLASDVFAHMWSSLGDPAPNTASSCTAYTPTSGYVQAVILEVYIDLLRRH